MNERVRLRRWKVSLLVARDWKLLSLKVQRNYSKNEETKRVCKFELKKCKPISNSEFWSCEIVFIILDVFQQIIIRKSTDSKSRMHDYKQVWMNSRYSSFHVMTHPRIDWQHNPPQHKIEYQVLNLNYIIENNCTLSYSEVNCRDYESSLQSNPTFHDKIKEIERLALRYAPLQGAEVDHLFSEIQYAKDVIDRKLPPPKRTKSKRKKIPKT